MTDQFKFNPQIPLNNNNNSNFNQLNIYNNSSQPSPSQYNDMMMDDEFSDNEYELSPKDDVPSPSKKRGRGPIQNGIRRSPNKWTKEENQKLFHLVSIYGEKKWKRISAEMGGQKTGAQCAQHWKRVLSPDIRKGPWDEDEEELLLRLVNQHGSCWKKIAKRICKRTDIQCRYQYLKALQSREILWVPKEDELLLKKVSDMGDNLSWLEVSEYLAKLKHTNTLRTALECKTRYQQLTDKLVPSIASSAAIIGSSSQGGVPSLLAHLSSGSISGSSADSGASSPALFEIEDSNNNNNNKSFIKSAANSLQSSTNSLRIHTLTNNINNGGSSSSSTASSSPMSSPISSPTQSPCTIKPNLNNLISNNHNHNNNNNIKSNLLNNINNNNHINNQNQLNTLPSLNVLTLPTPSNIKNFSINHLLDSKNLDINDDDDIDEPKVKKVRSNGEFYFQSINPPTSTILNNINNGINSDTSSDDDSFSPIKQQPNNNNNINILSPISNWDFYKNNSNINSNNNVNNSKIHPQILNSSPNSSPNINLPTIQKLKARSIDFFNLESLAAIATSQINI